MYVHNGVKLIECAQPETILLGGDAEGTEFQFLSCLTLKRDNIADDYVTN